MNDSTTSTGPNPSGLCMCGCGGKTAIAKSNDPRYGIVKGFPIKYVYGHHALKSPVDYIVDENGCWVWQRAVNSAGYGHLYVSGVHKYAHVHYYESANGALENGGDEARTTGTQVHHTCGNKLCVNPAHLVAESVRDHREGHGIYRYSDETVRAFRKYLRENPESTQRAASALFGISESHGNGLARGRFRSDI